MVILNCLTIFTIFVGKDCKLQEPLPASLKTIIDTFSRRNIYFKITYKPPTANVWNGACKMVIRLNQFTFSNFCITTGNNNMPGAAITILENITYQQYDYKQHVI